MGATRAHLQLVVRRAFSKQWESTKELTTTEHLLRTMAGVFASAGDEVTAFQGRYRHELYWSRSLDSLDLRDWFISRRSDKWKVFGSGYTLMLLIIRKRSRYEWMFLTWKVRSAGSNGRIRDRYFCFMCPTLKLTNDNQRPRFVRWAWLVRTKGFDGGKVVLNNALIGTVDRNDVYVGNRRWGTMVTTRDLRTLMGQRS